MNFLDSKNTIPENDFISGVPSRHQLEMAEAMMSLSLRDLNVFGADNQGRQKFGKKQIDETFDAVGAKLKEKLEESFDIFEDSDSMNELKLAQYSKLMLDNFAKIEALSRRMLNSKGIFSVVSEDIDAYLDSLDEGDLRNFDEDYQFTRDLKDSISQRMKIFLAQIPLVGRETLYKLPIYKDMNEVYAVLRNMLSDTYPDYNDMRDIMESKKGRFSWMQEVLDRLDNSPELRNEFVTAMTSHPVKMFFINVRKVTDEKTGEQTTEYYVASSNRNTMKEIVLESWKMDMYNNKKLYTLNEEDSKYYMTEPKEGEKHIVEQMIEKYWDGALTKVDPTKETFKAFFEDLGITLSDGALDAIDKEGFMMKNTSYSINSFFKDNSSNRGAKAILLDLKDLMNDNSAFEDINLLTNWKARAGIFASIAAIEGEYTDQAQLSAFRTGDKSVASHILNRYATNRVRDLKKDKGLREYLASTPYNSSKVLTWLEDERIRNEFDISYPDISQIFSNEDGSELRTLSPEQQIAAQIILFQNNAKFIKIGRERVRMAKMFYFTMSDKKNKYILDMPIPMVNYFDFFNEDGSFQTVVVDFIIDTIVLPEFRRINAELGVERNISGYDQGRFMFFHFEQLNDKTSPLWFEDGDGHKLNHIDLKEDSLAKDYVREVIATELKAEFDRLKANFGPSIASHSGKAYKNMLSENKVENILDTSIADFMLASNFSNMAITQLISGDPALFYKNDVSQTWDKYFISLEKDYNQWIELSNCKDEIVKVLVVEDILIDKVTFNSNQYFEVGDSKHGYQIATEGIGYITLSLYANLMYKKGELDTDDYREILDCEESGRYIRQELISKVSHLIPVELVSDLPDQGCSRKIFGKIMCMPIIPKLSIEYGLVDCLQKMKDKSIDIVVFESSILLGKPDYIAKFDNFSTWRDSATILVNLGDLKINSTFKRRNIFLKFLNLVNNSTTSINRLLLELLGMKYSKCMELIKDSENGINLNRVSNAIKSKLISNTQGNHIISNFDVIDNDFRCPFYLNPQRLRVEFLVAQWLKNELFYIEIGSKPYSPRPFIDFTSNYNYEQFESVIIYVKGKSYKDIRCATLVESSQTKVKVVIPWNFKDQNDKVLDIFEYIRDGFIDLNRLDLKLLNLILCTTDIQNISDCILVEVIGFLPGYYNNIILVPPTLKNYIKINYFTDLICLFHQYTVIDTDGYIRLMNRNDNIYKGVLNELLDASYESIVSFRSTVCLVPNEDLNDTFNLYGGLDNNSYLFPSKQLYLYERSKLGHIVSSLFYLLNQYNRSILNNPHEFCYDFDKLNIDGNVLGTKEQHFIDILTFGHLSSKGILNSNKCIDSKDNCSIQDLITKIQLHGRKPEKHIELEKLGLNQNNLYSTLALVQLGFPDYVIGTLLNSDFVRKYTYTLQYSHDNFIFFLSSLLDSCCNNGLVDTDIDKANSGRSMRVLYSKLDISVEEISRANKEDNTYNYYIFNSVALYKIYQYSIIGKHIYNQALNLNRAINRFKFNIFDSINMYDGLSHKLKMNSNSYSNLVTITDEESLLSLKVGDSSYFNPTSYYGGILINSIKVSKKLYDTKVLSLNSSPKYLALFRSLYKHVYGTNTEIGRSTILKYYKVHRNIIDTGLAKYFISGNKFLFPYGLSFDNINGSKIVDKFRQIKHLGIDRRLNNKFLISLEIIYNKIYYRASRMNSQYDYMLPNYFNELYMNDKVIKELDITTKDLFWDLVRYTLVSDPYQRATNYSKFIPPYLLSKIGLYDNYKEDNLNSRIVDMDTGNSVHHPFVLQFFQNNSNYLKSNISSADNVNIQDKKFQCFVLDNGSKIYPNRFSIIKVNNQLFRSFGDYFSRIPRFNNFYLYERDY